MSGGSVPWLLVAAVFTASMGYGAALPTMQFVLLRSDIAVTRAAISIHSALLAGTYMLAYDRILPRLGSMVGCL